MRTPSLSPRTTQQLELLDEANHTKEIPKTNGRNAEGASTAERRHRPRHASLDAANVGSSWEEERDGESAGGATETSPWQRAPPPQDGADAQGAATRVKAQTKRNAYIAAGRSRPARGIIITAGNGGNYNPSKGRSCGFGPTRGGGHEAKKAHQRKYRKRRYDKNKPASLHEVVRIIKKKQKTSKRYYEPNEARKWEYPIPQEAVR